MCTIKVCRPSSLLSSSLEIFANQLFRPNLNFLYVPIKLMTKLILRPKYFVVLSREELRLEIFLLHLLLKEWSIGKTWKVSENFFLRSKQVNFKIWLIFVDISWAPIPVNWYEIHSGYDPDYTKVILWDQTKS